jgi:hypothetical protein
VLAGKQMVFLSCMDVYADRLARPIRDRLNQLGYRAVILMDEPNLGGAWTRRLTSMDTWKRPMPSWP